MPQWKKARRAALTASTLLPRHAIVLSGVDVKPTTLRVKIPLVLPTSFLHERGNIAGMLNLAELDVTPALLDGVSYQFCRSGFTLCANDCCLLLLSCPVDQK